MHQRLRVLADYLLKCDSAAAVNPRDIDAKALPHLFILNVERGADATLSGLRIRFSGTALDRAFERKLIGNRLEDYVHGPRAGDVIGAFHDCAETGRALWMRQVVQLVDRPLRFVEGIAIRVAPDRIYGGLIIGEVAHDENTGFESRDLR